MKIILEFLQLNPDSSSSEIQSGIKGIISLATTKRELNQLLNENKIIRKGIGRAVRYALAFDYFIQEKINMDEYFSSDIDDRKIKTNFEFEFLRTRLQSIQLFNAEEQKILSKLQDEFQVRFDNLSNSEKTRALEHLAIDLSWKSSQIEGNTYSLLETEELIKQKITAAGKTRDEATMILNHKDAIDFIVENKNYLTPISLRSIEDLHSILIKELGVDKNIRKRKVHISGTNYTPLDNEFQITEALHEMCIQINRRASIFEKSFLALILISYIQPFLDGNKRTARLVSNAILIDAGYCPLSYRTVSSIHYKKSMLLFYELNNISAMKELFIDQYKFAVDNYF